MRRLARKGRSNWLDRVGEAGRDGYRRRRRLSLFDSLLSGLAMRVAQAGLLGIDFGHLASARHRGFSHHVSFGDLGIDRTDIACYCQLHEQQAEQRAEHCDQAMTAASKHNEIVGCVGGFGLRAHSYG